MKLHHFPYITLLKLQHILKPIYVSLGLRQTIGGALIRGGTLNRDNTVYCLFCITLHIFAG